MQPFYVYLLECADGSYYVGHTDDLARRMNQHIDGGDSYTSRRRPVRLVWHAEVESRAEALTREFQLKGWSRAKKAALVRGDWDGVVALAKSGDAGRLARSCFDRLSTNGDACSDRLSTNG